MVADGSAAAVCKINPAAVTVKLHADGWLELIRHPGIHCPSIPCLRTSVVLTGLRALFARLPPMYSCRGPGVENSGSGAIQMSRTLSCSCHGPGTGRPPEITAPGPDHTALQPLPWPESRLSSCSPPSGSVWRPGPSSTRTPHASGLASARRAALAAPSSVVRTGSTSTVAGGAVRTAEAGCAQRSRRASGHSTISLRILSGARLAEAVDLLVCRL